jgi:hypothetical protein
MQPPPGPQPPPAMAPPRPDSPGRKPRSSVKKSVGELLRYSFEGWKGVGV